MKKIVLFFTNLYLLCTAILRAKINTVIKKRILLFLVVLTFAFSNSFAASVWDGTSSTIWTNGIGTSDNPFLIENAANLAFLAQSVNNGTKYSGIFFTTMVDIDLNSHPWTPIGKNSVYCFSGNLDGNGHTVSNLFINTSILQYVGLFGYIKNASVMNIGITGNSSVTCILSFSLSSYVGSISGYAYSSNIINCYNSGTIMSSTVNSSSFEDCYVGGIVGEAYSTSAIVYCYNTATIYGEAFSNSTASSSSPLYNVNCAISFVGGITGYISNSVNLTNCNNAGNVTGVTSSYGSSYWSDCRVGGVVGEANATSSLSECYNTGTVNGTCNDNNSCYVGGVVGCSSDIILTDCFNEGEITGTLTNINGYSCGVSCYVSGILGFVHHSTATIKNCYNKGDISLISSKCSCCLGGVLGGVEYSASAILLNCFNTGNLSCTAYASAYTTVWGIIGGLVGSIYSNSNYISITNCYNSGSVTCSAPECNSGGIIGGSFASTYTINCYNVGSISGSGATYRYVGGIVGYIYSSFTATNCYYLNGCVSNPTNTQGILKTSDYMKSIDFVTDLNNGSIAWKQDNNSTNNGYPILTYLTGTVSTLAATEITQTSALLNGVININETIVTKGFQYKLSTQSAYTTIIVSDTSMNYHLIGLTPNTSYIYRIFVGTASLGVIYANTQIFTTLPVTTVTLPATNVTRTEATLNGKLSAGNAPITIVSKGFKYKKSSEGNYNIITVSEDTLTYHLTGLTPNVNYDYFAFVETLEYGILSGDIITFNTPLVTTLPVTNITKTSATISGEYDPSNIPFTVLSKGFEYKKISNNNYTIVTVAGDTFSYNLTGLIAATNYTLRAFIFTLEQGIMYGNELTFVTLQKNEPVITWNNPADIVYGSALSTNELNATTNIAGIFTYTPPLGTILNVGNGQPLRVDFTPIDTLNYTNASKIVTINVIPAILYVSTDSVNIEAAENSCVSVNITSNTTWTASSDQTWLTLSPNIPTIGNDSLTLMASVNPTNVIRTAIVTISAIGVTDQTITVIQDAGVTEICEISNDPLSIFPNPVVNELTINNVTQNAIILIYDLNGRLLINKTARTTTEKINVSSLINGIYSIKVVDKKKNRINNFIKQ